EDRRASLRFDLEPGRGCCAAHRSLLASSVPRNVPDDRARGKGISSPVEGTTRLPCLLEVQVEEGDRVTVEHLQSLPGVAGRRMPVEHPGQERAGEPQI